MKVWSDSFADGEAIPEKNAFGKHADEGHVALSDNRNPHVAWSEVPDGAESLVLIVHDPDVPSVGDDVNQEGRTVSASLPRVDFFHWVLLDVDPAKGSIAEGEMSAGVTARGKDGPDGPHGGRHGKNDYTGWFAGDADMGGDYYGWDGPCPPWNDEIVHHYWFTLFAVDVPRLDVEGDLTGPNVRAALAGHILDKASFHGTYAINPDARVARG